MPIYSSFATILNYSTSPASLSSEEVIGPSLHDTFPSLPANLKTFLDTYQRILYITLGSRPSITDPDTQSIIQGSSSAIEK